ncbi:MAG: hypothetical protein IK055_08500 [Lachnospiraceae bacterium]|nr:hypothetical protein [Lachnospiraceae bacterium]
MKRVLYIDFENVSQQGLKGIQKLTKNDLVRIFLGPKCSKMSLIDADMVFHCDATVELITNDQIGKNALDFIIMVHLGYDIAKKTGNAYYVVSNDKGYEPAINEMKSMTGCTIERLPDVDAVIARGGEVKTGLLSFLTRITPTPVADNTTQHEVLGKGAKKTTRRTVGNGAGNRTGEQTGKSGASHTRSTQTSSGRGSRTQGRAQAGDAEKKTVEVKKTAEVKRAGDAEKKTETPKKTQAAGESVKKTVRRTANKPVKDEEEIFRKGIETCRTKLEFHNYLAKELDNKDHIQELYNRGKKLLEIDEEAVRRENGIVDNE